jgi:putative pyoverdin transport system ATP-binding/permease protein
MPGPGESRGRLTRCSSVDAAVRMKVLSPSIFRSESLVRETLGLLRPFWPLTALAAGMGTLSGVATAWLLATVNLALHADAGTTLGLVLRFTGLCVLSVGGAAIAGVGNSLVGQRVMAALRKEISSRMLHAPIAAIERARAHRLLAVLTNDVDTVAAFTFNSPGYAIALGITLASLGYLLLLSSVVFLMAVAAVGAGLAFSIYARRSWIRDYEAVRSAQDELQKQYRATTDGAKELRLNRQRRQRVHGLLLSGATDRIASLRNRAARSFWMANAAGTAVFLAVIGLLLADGRRLGGNPSVVSGAMLVLLYLKGPIEQLASGLLVLGQAQVAFRRIAALSGEFSRHGTEPGDETNTTIHLARSIELRGVCHAFAAVDGNRSFTLGPTDLTIRRGEAVFVVGENGSGKTTLIKLLLGLYKPTSGRILVDGLAVKEGQFDGYRQLFSAVFSDYFLFDDLLIDDPAHVTCAHAYLERLKIAHKVRIQGGSFTTTDLSAGQRKRLALVHACLEQRPVMIFDEWAADQDPAFRRIFYTELVPDLKRQGKTLIIVSHDQLYFGAADRIIRLEAGRIVEDRSTVCPIATTL